MPLPCATTHKLAGWSTPEQQPVLMLDCGSVATLPLALLPPSALSHCPRPWRPLASADPGPSSTLVYFQATVCLLQ